MSDDTKKPEEPQAAELEEQSKSEFDKAVEDFDALVTLPDTALTGAITGIPKPIDYSVRTSLDASRWTMIDPNVDFQQDVILLRDPNSLATRGGERGNNLYIITGPVYLRLMESYPNLRSVARRYTLRMATYRLTDELVVFAIMHPLDGNERSESAYRAKLRVVEECETDWRMILRTDDGYRTISTELPNREPPDWPRLYRGMNRKAVTFKAFREQIIKDWDHAVIRVIRGAVVNLAELIEQTSVVVHDTEFQIREAEGARPFPWCEAWMDLRDRARHTQWLEGVDPSSLVTPPQKFRVAYNVSAETSVELQLGRAVPALGIDLYAEHRTLTNGLGGGNRLIDAMHFWGLDAMESSHKDLWHEHFINAVPPFPAELKEGALAYNFEDVKMTARLLEAMAPRIDLKHALLRFRYMVAIAEIQHTGIPVDVDLYQWIQANWDEIKQRMIDACPHDVFDGLSFSSKKFAEFLFEVLGADSWQRTESGQLVTSSRYFEHQAFEYPQVGHIHRVKRTLDTFDSFELGIGEDGRNRASWFPFRSKTGRNQPKRLNIFSSHSRWIRGLVTPAPGRALCELDYEQQEFGIVAALSGDPVMREAYLTGDPYLSLAVLAGAVPEGATKESHLTERTAYKVTALAVQFGSTAAGVARRLSVPHAEGALLMHHYDTAFERFRAWQLQKRINSRYGEPMVCPHGWRLLGAGDIKWRTIDNLWAQGTGSEMLRAAVVELRKAGIEIVALIHDAVIVEADASVIDDVAEAAAQIMGNVSEQVLGGRLRLRTEKTFVRPGDRLLCAEAMGMWSLVTDPYFQPR